jgi:hypothetical protein
MFVQINYVCFRYLSMMLLAYVKACCLLDQGQQPCRIVLLVGQVLHVYGLHPFGTIRGL